MQTTYFPIQHLDKPVIKPSGICELFFTMRENVQYWPLINPESGTYTDPITLVAEKTWFRCQMIDPDRDFKEAAKNESAGPFTEVIVQGFLPDNSPANTLSMTAMAFHEYILVVKERNGMMRLIGSQDAGATFTRTYASADLEGNRGNTLVFAWESPLPPAIYLTAVTANGEIINPPWEGGGGNEHDPTVPTWVKNISQADINKWNLAYSWGSHALAGYLKKAQADTYYAAINHTHSWDQITGKPDDIDIYQFPYTIVADGNTYSFSIYHGLEVAPTDYLIIPVTNPASGIYAMSSNQYYFTVIYDLCPRGVMTFNCIVKKS